MRNALLAALLPFAVLAARAEEDPEEDPGVVEAVAGEEAAPEPPPSPPPAEAPKASDQERRDSLRWEIDGWLAQEARLRAAGGETDFDLYTHVDAEASRGGRLPARARVNGRLVADVGGDQQPNDFLRDVWDGFEHDVQFRLYEGYGEIGGLAGGPLAVRGGRQFLDEGTYLHFDGVRLDLDAKKKVDGLDLTAFFGVPVRFGEQERSDAWLAGFVARMKFTDKTRARLEYVHVSEFFEGINDPPADPFVDPVMIPASDIDDDLLAVSVWHRLLDSVRLFGRLSVLDGDFNELHVLGRWFTKDGKWTVVVELYQLFGTLRNVTNDLTPFVPLLGNYAPFTRITVRATHRIGEVWVLQGALGHRELHHDRDEGTFNHEFNQYTFTATRLDLADRRLDATFVANGYTSTRNDVVALGGHVDFRLNSEVDLSGGIDYALFKYDWFQDTEREDVWTYSARVKWKIKKDVELVGSVSLDDDRFEEYWTVFVKLVWRF